MEDMVETLAQAALVFLALWYMRWWMGKSFDRIEIKADRIETKVDQKVDDHTCKERTEACLRLNDAKSKRVNGLEKQADEIWAAINHHGHKGLDADGNQVVRT